LKKLSHGFQQAIDPIAVQTVYLGLELRIMELKFKYKTMVKPVAYVSETWHMR
jgi:hypothetical protein